MIRGLLLILIGAAAFAGVYLSVPADEPEPAKLLQISVPAPARATPSEDALAAVNFELRPAVEGAKPQAAEVAASIRDVTPINMTAAPRVTGTLTRVSPPVEPPKARTERLYQPIVLAAGLLRARERQVRLAGIAAPEFDARCGEGASAWPCGRMARAALRSFIRGRAIECEVPAGAKEIPDLALCNVGGQNISEWLIAQGWAKRTGEDFGNAEDAARNAKLGLWGDGRPDQPAAVATSG